MAGRKAELKRKLRKKARYAGVIRRFVFFTLCACLFIYAVVVGHKDKFIATYTQQLPAVNATLIPPLPTQVRVALKLEVASTEKQRARGLMERKHMPAEEGMLFVYKEPNQQYFWMHNTYIPLDIIFFLNNIVVGAVENAQPHDETFLTVPYPADKVVELNAGSVEKYGITPGWRLYINTPQPK